MPATSSGAPPVRARARAAASTPSGPARRHRLPTWARLTVAVVVALLVLEGGVRLISDQLPAPVIDQRQEEVQLKAAQIEALAGTPVDTVVLGSSIADAGVDAAALAATSTVVRRAYNAALLGMPITFQGPWIDGVVLPELDPELALVGLLPADIIPGAAPLFFPGTTSLDPSQDGVLEAIAQENLSVLDEGLLATIDEVATERSYAVRYRGSLRSPRLVGDAVAATLRGDDPDLPPTRPTPEGGLVTATGGTRLYHGLEAEQVASALLDRYDDARSSEVRTARLELALDHLVDEVDQVVVFIPPVALDLVEGQGGLDLEWYLGLRDQLVDLLGAQDVPVIDLTEAGYETALFADPLHLNERGSARLSADLARAVDQRCTSGPPVRCDA